MTFTESIGTDGAVRLVITGDLDRVTVPDLRNEVARMLASRPPYVEIDLSDLTTIDSAGVGTLVSLYKGLIAQGGRAVVVGVRDQPLAIFKLLRLDKVMFRPRPSPSEPAPGPSGARPVR
jgi:anti-sigma B factor antagonist